MAPTQPCLVSVAAPSLGDMGAMTGTPFGSKRITLHCVCLMSTGRCQHLWNTLLP